MISKNIINKNIFFLTFYILLVFIIVYYYNYYNYSFNFYFLFLFIFITILFYFIFCIYIKNKIKYENYINNNQYIKVKQYIEKYNKESNKNLNEESNNIQYEDSFLYDIDEELNLNNFEEELIIDEENKQNINNILFKNKLLLIIYGESFRDGHRFSRIRDCGDICYINQKKATYSHILFCKFLKNNNIDVDIIINTYDTIYEEDLKKWYNKYNLKYFSNTELIGVDNLVNNSIKNIENLYSYDYILTTRLDIYLKLYFAKIFNKNWNKIMFISMNSTRYDTVNEFPAVNPIIEFIPKKYFYLNFISVEHDAWYIYTTKYNLNKNDMDFMLDYYYDADSYKDYNPVYRMISRPESKIWLDKNIKINRDKW